MKNCIALAFLLVFSQTAAVLNNLPVTFSMIGTTTYNPDIGGAAQNGYRLTLGYVGTSWLGVQFVNSGYNSDVLVLKLSDFYANTGNPLFDGHQILVQDYYRDSRGLKTDTINTFDISASGYSKTKKYQLTLTRYIGSNSNQDWNAQLGQYSVQKICFYTSSQTFDATTIFQQSPVCVNYEIDNFVSTYVGYYLKQFKYNGYPTQIYGYIDGPALRNKLYFYQLTQLFAYVRVPAIAIEIGSTAGQFGQDFYVASPQTAQNGDYYGASINTIALDNNAQGFQNSALTLNTWNADPSAQIAGFSMTGLRIHFDRAVQTYDPYDKNLLSTFVFCLYMYSSGSISGLLSDKSCEMVELSRSYVQSKITVLWEKITLLGGAIGVLLFLL